MTDVSARAEGVTCKGARVWRLATDQLRPTSYMYLRSMALWVLVRFPTFPFPPPTWFSAPDHSQYPLQPSGSLCIARIDFTCLECFNTDPVASARASHNSMPLHVAQRARQRTEIQPPPVVASSLPLPPPLMPPTQLLAQLTIAHGASFLPCGHTHFSWQSAHTGAVPPGHTPFSWGTAL